MSPERSLLALALVGGGLVIDIVALAYLLKGRWRVHRALGFMIIGDIGVTLSAIVSGVRPLAMIDSAMTAYAIYVWWNKGGGDGTKKRLRSLARKFTPVRRTAPQTT